MSDENKAWNGTNFLGIKVHGDIISPDTVVPQRPIEELKPAMQAVLTDESVALFGWTQYTPYFNDGDPCVFGVSSFWCRPALGAIVWDPSKGREVEWTDELNDLYGYWDLGLLNSTSVWGDIPRVYNPETNRYESSDEFVGVDLGRYHRLQHLSREIQSGAFNNALLDAFGDHALVTVRKDRIDVEGYGDQHD